MPVAHRCNQALTTLAAELGDLAQLLDLVALGTVADLVPLDGNNRILVEAGLRRIRGGRASPGVEALFRAAGREPARAVAADFGFAIAPRLNAAGRLEDMRLGIECLLAKEAVSARRLAGRLCDLNTERRELQTAMLAEAEARVADFLARRGDAALPHGLVLHEPGWHPGVVGLVASRLKDRLQRPVIACAPAAEGSAELRGSARSIAGFHLRDALAEIDVRAPGLIGRFGGHAMAAGLSLPAANLDRLANEFDAVARRHIPPGTFAREIASDGELAPAEFTHAAAEALRYGGPWGQGLPEPVFDNLFTVESWRVLGGSHLKLELRPDGLEEPIDAILFGADMAEPPALRLRAAFRLDLNFWQGRERLQLLLEHIEAA